MRIRGWIRNLALVLMLLGYEWLAHLLTVGGAITPLGLALVLIPLALGAAWALVWEFGWGVATVVLLASTLALAAVHATFGLPDSALLFGLPHFASNLFLLWFFVRSLRPGREALITRVARRMRGGDLPAPLEAYTRRVTLAWGLFFLAQILVSLVLYLSASRESWSLFINIVSSLLIPVMFVCEYGYRRWRYRQFDHTSLFKAASIFGAPDRPTPPVDPS